MLLCLHTHLQGAKAAAGIVWKEKANVKVVTEDDERVHKVLLDAWYKMTLINQQAICLGYFTDA